MICPFEQYPEFLLHICYKVFRGEYSNFHPIDSAAQIYSLNLDPLSDESILHALYSIRTDLKYAFFVIFKELLICIIQS